jgi:hypothetical protein
MLTLVIIGAAVVLAGSGLAVWMRAAPDRALAPVDTRVATVFSLQPGDIVQYTGTDYVVDSTIRYEQDGIGWQEHLLGGGDRDLWLVVEEDDRVLLALVEVVDDPDHALPPTPIDSKETVVFRGEPYKLREAGHAGATRILPGTGTPQTVGVDFIDYERDDGQLLSVEFWPPNDREVSHGRRIPAAALNILPAS